MRGTVIAGLVGAVVTACASPTAPVLRLDSAGTARLGGVAVTYRSDGAPGPPRPTALLLSGRGDEALTLPGFAPVADVLVAAGWLTVSLDLPAHGADTRPGENAVNGFDGWGQRIAAGENLADAFGATVGRLLDALTRDQWTDPRRIAIGGVSRGGFLAAHAAARDRRIRAVALLAPVTDLAVVAELQHLAASPLLQALSLTRAAPRIAPTPVWLRISDHDDRVGTAAALAFADALRQGGGPIVLEVVPGPGHALPAGSPEAAAQWLTAQVR